MRGLIITMVCVVVCIVLAVCLAGSSDCMDEYSVTTCWHDLHRCNEVAYQGLCKKSCGICDNCTDLQNAQYCWNNASKCNENNYQTNCKKTCGLCDGCADIRNDCSRRISDCGVTRILVGCRKTCGACHIQDTEGRETDDTMTTTTSTHAERTIPKDNQENRTQVGNWGTWEPWGLCSATCGTGITSRWRTCSPVGAKCHGDNTETTDCHLTDCCVPRDGTWGDWSDWSTCSYTCGGSRDMTRKCNEPNPCGQPCEGKSYESTACNVETCPRSPANPSITTDPPTSPFSVGVTVTLTCSSLDLGSPPATLTWVTSIQGTKTTQLNNQRIQLQILNLSVEDDEDSVKCLANNIVSETEKCVVLRVDQKASYGECRALVSSSTWQVAGYCDITQVFSSNNQYQCYWYEVKGRDKNKIPSSFNPSLITPGRKLQKGKCGFQTKIPRDFLERREVSRELKYQMYFNPGDTWSPIINVTVASPVAPTLTCPPDVMEDSHMNCTCSTSDVGEPGGRLLLFSNDRLEDTGQYGQKVIILSRDVRRKDNNVRVNCRLHWARNMSADRDWTLRVLLFPVDCSDNLTDCPHLATRCADSFVQEVCRKTCSRCQVHRNSSDAAIISFLSVCCFGHCGKRNSLDTTG